MTSRELVVRTLNFDSPPRIPRQCWLLPWAEKHYPAEAARLAKEYPDDLLPVPAIYRTGKTVDRYREGTYVDEWGCTFKNIHEGLIGVPAAPLISSWDQLRDFKPPAVTLDLDTDRINTLCRSTDKFTYSSAWIRPFERYQFIRSTELTMMDIALDCREMRELISIVHSHYLLEAEAWAHTDIDAIGIMDDWGMQNGMLVSPEFFRKYFKPMYSEYAGIAHRHGKYLFMHSDGDITEIFADLIDAGVDAINSQVFCMDIPVIGTRFRGKITFWGEIDRQHILPGGSKNEIDEAVMMLFSNLYHGGGIIGQCEFGPAAKPENIFYVFEAWNKIKTHI